MKYIVLDLETDGRTTYKRFCNPLDHTNPEHKIVCCQTKEKDKDAEIRYHHLEISSVNLLVGQNIKFDLLWLWDNEGMQSFFNHGYVWDTAIVEYLLQGQRKRSYSLDALSEQYGGTAKIDVVKALLKEGKLFSEIPQDVAMKYAKDDVINTELIFLKQYEKAKKMKMLPIIKIWMMHLVAITEMEYNGLHIDMPRFQAGYDEAKEVFEKTLEELETAVKPYWSTDKIEYNFKSSDHNSALLYGGELPFETQIPNPSKTGEAYYKTGKKAGQLRMKKGIGYSTIAGLGLDREEATKAEKDGFFLANDKVINELCLSNLLLDNELYIIKLLQKIRAEYKVVSTYYEGLKDCIHPDCCLHTEFKMHFTATGRLSSRNPNVQNLHPGILDSITSRHDDYTIVEFDYSSLEVRVAASLSNDATLIDEINQGLDMHRHNAARLYNKDSKHVTASERKITKALTFGLLYGQGARAMSMVHSIDVKVAKRFIDGFYDKYKDIHYWHEDLIKQVDLNKTGNISQYRSKLGKIYTFELGEAPDFMKRQGRYYSFKPTDIKNYTVQGTASVIVSTAAGLVYRAFKNNPDVIMVNEVHDSLIFEIKQKHDNCIEEITQIMSIKTKEYIKNNLGYEFPVTLEVDCSQGNTWRDCK